MLGRLRLINFIFIIMSKGPITARIDQVENGKDCFIVSVTSVSHARKSKIKIPNSADISAFEPDKFITFCLAEDVSTDETFMHHGRDDERAVVVFLSNDYGKPYKNNHLWLEKGKTMLNLQKLPHIVETLFEVSSYYRERRILVEKALDVLNLTQDLETVDALFSMKAKNLYLLLGNKLEPLPQATACQLGSGLRLTVIEDFFIPVQIADCLLAMAENNIDLENPCRRDLRHLLFLAQMHGESKEKIDAFIANYKQQ